MATAIMQLLSRRNEFSRLLVAGICCPKIQFTVYPRDGRGQSFLTFFSRELFTYEVWFIRTEEVTKIGRDSGKDL